MRRKIPSSAERNTRNSLKSAQTPGPVSPTKRASPQKRRTTADSQNASANVSRRTRRFKSGTKALKEIRALQRTTSLLLPKASFCRLVREIMNSFTLENMRIQSDALLALQEATEMYMVQFFEDSLLCTLHSKRVTLHVSDCHLMRRLRGPNEVGNR